MRSPSRSEGAREVRGGSTEVLPPSTKYDAAELQVRLSA
jgi:hypothetical protein